MPQGKKSMNIRQAVICHWGYSELPLHYHLWIYLRTSYFFFKVVSGKRDMTPVEGDICMSGVSGVYAQCSILMAGIGNGRRDL